MQAILSRREGPSVHRNHSEGTAVGLDLNPTPFEFLQFALNDDPDGGELLLQAFFALRREVKTEMGARECILAITPGKGMFPKNNCHLRRFGASIKTGGFEHMKSTLIGSGSPPNHEVSSVQSVLSTDAEDHVSLSLGFMDV